MTLFSLSNYLPASSVGQSYARCQRASTLTARIMAQADSTGARKCSTRKTKSTKDEEAFLYDFSLPSVPLSSALDPKVPPDTLECHKSGAPLGVAQTLTPQHPFSGDSASPDYLTQNISLVQAERQKLALELELLHVKREQPLPATPQSDQGSTAPASTNRKKTHRRLTSRFHTRYVHQP